jgi:hypothetical protein
MRLIILSIFAAAVSSLTALAGDLPDPEKTPGVCRTDLTKEQICATKWGKDHRAVTAAMKKQVFLSYGYPKLNKDPRCPCEIDHLCSRELGGADVIENLWVQSYRGPWNARDKDRVENKLNKVMCAGPLSLQEAQDEIVSDWKASYQRHIGARPNAGTTKRRRAGAR